MGRPLAGIVCKVGERLNNDLLDNTAVGRVLSMTGVVPGAVVVANKEAFVSPATGLLISFSASPGWKAGLPAKNPPTNNNPHIPATAIPETAGCRSIAAHKRFNHGDWVMASSNVSNRAVSPARNRAVTWLDRSLK